MSDATYQFDPVLIGREMHAIEAWLQRAGIEPKNVPVDATVVFHDDGRMTVDVHLRNADGSRYLIDGVVARGTATVPLVQPPAFESLIAMPARSVVSE